MPYLGTQAAVGFSKTTKDRFSGDNSTTGFTMSQAAGTGTDIQVFVDNIRQEPTIAYSVSGTTLTFTEAPPTGTNNVYVIHQHQALGTGPLPPQDLGTTDYIFGDDISFNSDASVINMGLDSEIKITHVHNTGILLTDSGGSPTLQLHDSNESVSSDGSNLILTSGGTAFTLPTSDGTDGQFLKTDASGNLSFATVTTGLTGIDDQSSSNDDQITITDTDVIINEDSDDLNFRVETNTLTNALFVDGGNNAVGINTTAASSGRLLHIEGGDTTVGITLKDTAGSQFGITSDGGNLTIRSDTASSDRFKIDANGVITVPSDAGAATTEVTQGLAKMWIQFNGTGTIATADSFNTSSITDNAVGHYQVNIANDMNNDDFSVTFGLGRIDGSGSGQLMASSGLGTGTGIVSMYNQNTSGALTDTTQVMCTVHGDLA